MKKLFKLSSVLICVAILVSSMSIIGFADDFVLGDVDGSQKVDTQDARIILEMAAGITVADVTKADMNGDGIVSLSDVVEALKIASNVGSIVIPDKNGDNELSDDPNNEFIKLISEKYGVDTKALVAIYSTPDTGTNYVLQFKKSLIGSTYKKDPDNLVKVYHVGVAPEREISYTDGKLVGGDHYNCSETDGVIVFTLVKSKVMPQYPTYFEGV